MTASSGSNAGIDAFGGEARWCTPMYRTRPSFFQSLRTPRYVGMSAPEATMATSILFTLNFANFSSIPALRLAASGFGGGPPAVGGGPEKGVVQTNLS